MLSLDRFDPLKAREKEVRDIDSFVERSRIASVADDASRYR